MRLSSGLASCGGALLLLLGGLSRSSPDGPLARAVCGLLFGCRPYLRQSPCPDPSFLSRWPSTVAGDDARLSCRSSAAQQGRALSSRSADRRGDLAVMRIAGDGLHGRRLRGLIVVLWRAGLRIDEALALREADLDHAAVQSLSVGQRRTTSRDRMDDWGWQELEPWLIARVALPIGPLFCVINGRTRGRPWTTSGARAELRRAAARAGVADASPLTSCATHTRSRWPAKASRSSSSNASSGTATSGSPRSICRASITPRSSRRSTRAAPQWCR